MTGSHSVDPTSVPNRELVVYALAMAGGGLRRIHTEDVALKAHELFPGSFSWTKHPEIPDKDIVRVALTDARKEEFGSLVEGRSGTRRGQTARTRREPAPDGWRLTESGLGFLKDRDEDIAQLVRATGQKDHRQVARRGVRRLKDHPLFSTFVHDREGFDPSIGELADVLRCRVDAEPSVWRGRLDNVARLSVEVEDDDFREFVRKLETAYEQER
jgi:hypothetical protein